MSTTTTTRTTTASSAASSASSKLRQKPWFRRPDLELYPHTPCGKRKWRHTRIVGRFSPAGIQAGDLCVLEFDVKKARAEIKPLPGARGCAEAMNCTEELEAGKYWETEEEARKRTPLTPRNAPFYPFATKHDYEWARGFFNNFHPDDSERLMKMWIDGFLWEGLDEYQICSFQTAAELWALLESAPGGVRAFRWNPPLDGDGEKLPRLVEERLAGRCW